MRVINFPISPNRNYAFHDQKAKNDCEEKQTGYSNKRRPNWKNHQHRLQESQDWISPFESTHLFDNPWNIFSCNIYDYTDLPVQVGHKDPI